MMATTSTSIELLQSLLDASSRGNIPYILSQIAPGATWRLTKTLPWGGDYRGPEGAREFFEKMNASMETVSFEARENVDRGNEVFSFGSYSGRSRRTGRTGTAEWMFRWRVQDGKVVSWENYIDSAAVLAALQ